MNTSSASEVFAILWAAIEACAVIPPQLACLVVPLIPKASGGLRDLGLFPGPIRVGRLDVQYAMHGSVSMTAHTSQLLF